MVRENGANAIGGEGVPEGIMSDPQSRLRARGTELMDRVREAPQSLEQVNQAFIGFVREQPLVALGAAVGIGYVLGRMLRRVV